MTPAAADGSRSGTIGRRTPADARGGHDLTVEGRTFPLPDADRQGWGAFASRFGPFDRLELDGILGDLARPDLALHSLLELLAPGGLLVVRVRVISHADDRVRLGRGAWPPSWSSGELRFFTRSSLTSLLAECSLELVDIEFEHAPIDSPEAARLLTDDQQDTIRRVVVTSRRARRGAIPPPRTFEARTHEADGCDDPPDRRVDAALQLLRGRRRVLAVQPPRALTESLVEAGHATTVLDRDVPSPSRFTAEHVVTADLDVEPLPGSLAAVFDAVLLHDVLTVVTDPVRYLRAARRCLAPDGIAVVSVPNGVHTDVRVALAAGRWPWCDGGPLDRAAVRLSTHESLRADVEAAGLDVLARHDDRSRRWPGPVDQPVPTTDAFRRFLAHDGSAAVSTLTWVVGPTPRVDRRGPPTHHQ